MGGWLSGKPDDRGSSAKSSSRTVLRSRMISPSRPWPCGSGPIAAALLGVQAERDEPNERFAAGVDDTEGTVAHARQSTRRLDDQRKQLVEVGVRLDQQYCVDQGVESRWIVDFMKRHWSHSPTVGKQRRLLSVRDVRPPTRGEGSRAWRHIPTDAGTAHSRGTRWGRRRRSP